MRDYNHNSIWVYLIHSVGTTYYKIGIARSIKNRLHQMQTGNPHELKVVAKTRHSNAFVFEQQLHTICQNNKKRGEWFELDDYELTHIKLLFLQKESSYDFSVARDIWNSDQTSEKKLALISWALGIT